VVEETNLHRQPLYGMKDLGKPKAEIARARLLNFNPLIAIDAVVARLTPQNASELAAKTDLVIDAADSFAVTYMLSDVCQQTVKVLVSASVIGMTGYAGAFCGGGPSYRAVFPDVSIDGGTCATVGVLGTAVAVLGGLQAHLALSLLLGVEPSVLGRVITFDAQRAMFGGFAFAGTPEPFIAPAAVMPDDIVVDLRSLEEAPQSPFAGAHRIEVDGIGRMPMPERSQRVVLCCRSGQRSLMAADILRELGVTNLALVALG
jgi:rhodanese-related sulfurtransferase